MSRRLRNSQARGKAPTPAGRGAEGTLTLKLPTTAYGPRLKPLTKRIPDWINLEQRMAQADGNNPTL